MFYPHMKKMFHSAFFQIYQAIKILYSFPLPGPDLKLSGVIQPTDWPHDLNSCMNSCIPVYNSFSARLTRRGRIWVNILWGFAIFLQFGCGFPESTEPLELGALGGLYGPLRSNHSVTFTDKETTCQSKSFVGYSWICGYQTLFVHLIQVLYKA